MIVAQVLEWWQNGGRGWVWDVLPLVFAAGALWARLRGVQTSVDKLERRVGGIEATLMRAKG